MGRTPSWGRRVCKSCPSLRTGCHRGDREVFLQQTPRGWVRWRSIGFPDLLTLCKRTRIPYPRSGSKTHATKSNYFSPKMKCLSLAPHSRLVVAIQRLLSVSSPTMLGEKTGICHHSHNNAKDGRVRGVISNRNRENASTLFCSIARENVHRQVVSSHRWPDGR